MKRIILILIACLPLAMQAQDFHWSQINMNPIYLNPAFTGFANKANRITGLYRDQWRSVPVPYSTTHVSYDRKLWHDAETGIRLGIGGQLLYDKAGDGALSTFRPAVNFAAGKYFNSEKQLVTLGVQGAWARKQLDFSKLTFDTQYDGVIYNPDLPQGEVVAGDNASYFDLGLGINFQSKIKEKSKLDIGFSAFNLTSPGYSFLSGSEAEVAPRLMAYGKADVQLGQSSWQFHPGVYYQSQEKFQQTLLQSLFSVTIGKNVEGMQDTRLQFGPGYRLGDAVVGYVGVLWKDLKVGFAFDGNVSDFNVATRGRGAYELAVNYEWERKKKPEPEEFEPVIEEEPEEEEEEELIEEEVVEVIEEVIVEKIDPITPLERKLLQFEADLKIMPPVRLFFDNDRPNPRTRQTTTEVTFAEAFEDYKTVKPQFVERGGDDFTAFFVDNVQKGFEELNATLEKFEALLAAGKSIGVELRGFASPLSNPSYNLSLTERRIAAINNYLLTWNNGVLKSYIESGKLTIAGNPLGDTKANQAVSSDAKDKKNSIYSTAASFERRVELMILKVQ
jgi:type IX secretion system PorP/SprF family membrane protein